MRVGERRLRTRVRNRTRAGTRPAWERKRLRHNLVRRGDPGRFPVLSQIQVPLRLLLFRRGISSRPHLFGDTGHTTPSTICAILPLNPFVTDDLPWALKPDPTVVGEGKVEQRFLIARRDGTCRCGVINPRGDLVGRNDSFFFSLLRVNRGADNVDISLC